MKGFILLVLLHTSLMVHAEAKEILFKNIPYGINYKQTETALKHSFPNRKLRKGTETNYDYRPLRDETFTVENVSIEGQRYGIRFYVNPVDKLYKCTILGRNAEDKQVGALVKYLKRKYGDKYSTGDTELYYGTLRFHHYKYFKNYVWDVPGQRIRLDFGRSLPRSAFVYVDIEKTE